MTNEPIRITFRIPGKWANPIELVEQLPKGYRLTPEALILPNGTELEYDAKPADDQFAKIFRSSCRHPATAEELSIVDNYTVNFCFGGPGGSLESALTMMRAAAAIVQAGGAGVFIDNSALAHGGANWTAMAEDGGPDAVSFAFVAIVGGREEVKTMGMHVLGLREIVMKKADADDDEFNIVEVIRYLARGDKPVEDGHLLADLDGPRFKCVAQKANNSGLPTPMQNPFGQFKLVSMRDIAEAN
jgi:hypothetical protein